MNEEIDSEADFAEADLIIRTNFVSLVELVEVVLPKFLGAGTGHLIGLSSIADDVLTSSLLAVTCPVLIAPAMNVRMWGHKAVTRNVTSCRELGYEVLEPGAGFLACRDVGAGRLPEPADIAARVAALLAP